MWKTLKSISHVFNCVEVTNNRNCIILSVLTVNNIMFMQGKTPQFGISWFCLTNCLHILRLNDSLHRYYVQHCQFPEECLIHTALQRLGVLASFTVSTINLRCAYHQIVVCLNTDAWPPFKMPCFAEIRLTKNRFRLKFLVLLYVYFLDGSVSVETCRFFVT